MGIDMARHSEAETKRSTVRFLSFLASKETCHKRRISFADGFVRWLSQSRWHWAAHLKGEML